MFILCFYFIVHQETGVCREKLYLMPLKSSRRNEKRSMQSYKNSRQNILQYTTLRRVILLSRVCLNFVICSLCFTEAFRFYSAQLGRERCVNFGPNCLAQTDQIRTDCRSLYNTYLMLNYIIAAAVGPQYYVHELCISAAHILSA